MFEQIFERLYYVSRHAAAPFAEERERYLAECVRRGEARVTVKRKADELYWVAHKLHVYRDLHLTLDQVRAAALDCDWKDRERAYGRKLNRRSTREQFVDSARPWLRYLGYLPRLVAPIPFQVQLDQFCRWARDERGLTQATVKQYFKTIKLFLRWYGDLDRPLSNVQINDIDAYLAHGSDRGWCRITVSNTAAALRTFFRYGASQRWVPATLAR